MAIHLFSRISLLWAPGVVLKLIFSKNIVIDGFLTPTWKILGYKQIDWRTCWKYAIGYWVPTTLTLLKAITSIRVCISSLHLSIFYKFLKIFKISFDRRTDHQTIWKPCYFCSTISINFRIIEIKMSDVAIVK